MMEINEQYALLSSVWVEWAKGVILEWNDLAEASNVGKQYLTYNEKPILVTLYDNAVFITEGAVELLADRATKELGFTVEDIIYTAR